VFRTVACRDSVDLQGPFRTTLRSSTYPAFGEQHTQTNRSRMLNADSSNEILTSPRNDCDASGRERRLELLIRRLPSWMQGTVRWLRQPSARWLRIPTGLMLIIGGFLSILPVLGLWMLPLGLVLLAEDIPPLRRATNRALLWIERRRPHWMGLPPASTRNAWTSEEYGRGR
jgi:hypothetical protein